MQVKDLVLPSSSGGVRIVPAGAGGGRLCDLLCGRTTVVTETSPASLEGFKYLKQNFLRDFILFTNRYCWGRKVYKILIYVIQCKKGEGESLSWTPTIFGHQEPLS